MSEFIDEQEEIEYDEDSFYDCEECIEEDCTGCEEFESDIPEMEYDEYEIESVEE